MEQEVAINRILRDLKMKELISDDASGEIKLYLNALWVAGFESGAKSTFSHGEKTVIEYNSKHNEINSFPSVIIAAKRKRVDKTTLYKAIHENRATKDGHFWKYKETISTTDALPQTK